MAAAWNHSKPRNGTKNSKSALDKQRPSLNCWTRSFQNHPLAASPVSTRSPKETQFQLTLDQFKPFKTQYNPVEPSKTQ